MLKSCFDFLTFSASKGLLGAKIDITSLIPQFLKKGRDATGYEYVVTMPHEQSDLKSFYFDASHKLILYCRKKNHIWKIRTWIPIACIAFDKDTTEEVICIKQIQGPSYDSRNREFRTAALAEIKWERLLVQVVCDWAKRNKIRRVELISCTASKWYVRSRHEQMFMRYDVTARRLKFSNLNGKKLYVLDIS